MNTKKQVKTNPIKVGKGAPPISRSRYPFDSLKKRNDWFQVDDVSLHASIRSQASKKTKATGIQYAVNKKDDSIVVTRLA